MNGEIKVILKKNKNKKLKRKDRFKEIKKGVIPMSNTPAFLKKVWGTSVAADNGIFQSSNNLFDRMYKVKINDRKTSQQEIFNIFRNYDIRFKISYLDEDIYICFLFDKKSIEDVWVECDAVEKKLLLELNANGIELIPLNLQERLKTVHRFVTEKEPMIANYTDPAHILDWKEDLELSSFSENEGIMEHQSHKYIIFFISSFSDKTNNFIEELREQKIIKSIAYDISPVSDRAVKAFFDSNYMGCENILYNIKKNEPELYDVYTNDSENDSRYFSLVSISFLCNIETTSELERIKMLVDRYSLGIKFCHQNIVRYFKSFCCMCEWNYNQARCIKSKEAAKLLFALELEKEIPPIIEMLNISQLQNFTLDEIENTKSEKYSIDDYDENDENEE